MKNLRVWWCVFLFYILLYNVNIATINVAKAMSINKLQSLKQCVLSNSIDIIAIQEYAGNDWSIPNFASLKNFNPENKTGVMLIYGEDLPISNIVFA